MLYYKHLVLSLLLFLFNQLVAINLGYTTVQVRDRQFNLDYANYGYAIDTIKIIQSAKNGSFSLITRSSIGYSTTQYSIKDTAVIALAYTFVKDSNLVQIIDTIGFELQVLGKANTTSSFYSISGPLYARFTNMSNSDTTILKCLWSFGDSTYSASVSPQHNFQRAGDYDVCLSSYTALDTNTYCQLTTVFDSTYLQAYSDVANFYFPDSVIQVDVLDNDLYYRSKSLSIIKQGVFGQASFVNNQLIYRLDSFQQYQYDVIQYALFDGNTYDTADLMVYLMLSPNYPYCKPNFNYTQNLKTLSFSNASKCAAKNSVLTYTWDFGDSMTSSQASPNHTYANFGTYNVCLEIEDSLGLKNKWCQFLYVYDNRCQPDFGYIVGIQYARFDMHLPCPDAIAYAWDFGDSTGSSDMSPDHYYTSSGTYNVCLTKYGLSDTLTVCKTVTLLDTNALIAYDDYVQFQYSNNEVELKLLENDVFYKDVVVGLLDTPSLVNIRCDGRKVYLKNKRYVFSGETTFSYVINRNGKFDTALVYVSLMPKYLPSSCQPKINYSISGKQVSFTYNANCLNADSVVFQLWTFGDQDTSMRVAPVRTFSKPGIYSVQLTLIDSFGYLSYAFELICIVDSSINNGNVQANDDAFQVNIFSLSNRYNVLYNDVNINFKNAKTTLVKAFAYGLSYFDSIGNFIWLPDSGYRGCDTLQYALFDKNNSSFRDTASVFVCFDDLGKFCVDSSLIDSSNYCESVNMTVCGCNGIEYKNACEAFSNAGVMFYLNGPCKHYIPDLSLSQSSSKIEMFNDEIKEITYDVASSNQSGFDIKMATKGKVFDQSCLQFKIDEKSKKIILQACNSFVGNVKFYTTVCDQLGACNIDTFNVNVMSRLKVNGYTAADEPVLVYPNPFNQSFNIETYSENQLHYSVSSITGVLIEKGIVSGYKTIDTDQLQSGVYVLSIFNLQGDLIKVEKLIKH